MGWTYNVARKMSKRFVSLAAILFIELAAVGFLRAGVFLSSPAGPPVKADAMVILGGDSGSRTLKGIELYKEGYAPRVILTGLEEGEPGAQNYYLHWRSQMLLSAGMPKRALQFDTVSRNTWEEAENTLKKAQAAGWKTVLVVSDPPHMRRLNWVWSKLKRGTGVSVVLVAASPSWWDAKRWWRNDISAKFVTNEYLKMAYYLVAH